MPGHGVVSGFAAVVSGAEQGPAPLADYAGLATRAPALAAVLMLMMLAMGGIPLTAGFVAKAAVFSAALEADYLWLVVLALVAAAAGLFFYLRVVVLMYMQPGDGAAITTPRATALALGVAVLVTLVAGVVLWVVGFVFEAVGDRQLRAFKADPANRGRIMDRGLWAWTRHPNYFGDATVWWGLWLIAASVWPGVLTVASPAIMTYFLVYATGARLLERSMSQRPGYPEYQQRTSYFLPRPPRRALDGAESHVRPRATG